MTSSLPVHRLFLVASTVIIFGLYLGLNFLALHTVAPDLGAALVLLLALIGSVIISALTAKASYSKYLLGTKGPWMGRWGRYLGWLLALYLVSGYGIFSGLMLIVEGPRILDDVIQDARGHVIALDELAKTNLPPKEFDLLSAWTEAKLGNLRREMVDGDGAMKCGLGTFARRTLMEIDSRIGNVPFRNGVEGDRNCRNSPRNTQDYQVYEKAVRESLAKTSVAVTARAGARQNLLAVVGSDRAKIEAALDAQRQRLAGKGNFLSDYDMFPETIGLLRRVADFYATDRAAVVALEQGLVGKLPERLDISMAENLASPFYVFTVWRTRWTHYTTWLFTIVPGAVDFILSAMGAFAISAHLARSHRAQQLSDYATIPGTNIAYLWVPPTD